MLKLALAQDINLPIDHALWQKQSKERPITNAHLVLKEEGLHINFTVQESHPPFISAKEQGEVMPMVCQDSAVELFLAFALEEKSSLDKSFKPNLGECIYLNLEFNALGICYAKHGQYRQNRIAFTPEQIKSLKIKATIDDTSYQWHLSFMVPHQLITSIVKYNALQSGHSFAFNLYKISETQAYEHYLAYSPIDEKLVEKPNFHLPQYFALAYID